MKKSKYENKDLRELRKAKKMESDKPTVSISKVKKELESWYKKQKKISS